MLDLSAINKRYFKVKIGTLTLELEPPKVKTLRKVLNMSKKMTSDSEEMSVEAVDELAEAIADILTKNKKKEKITPEFVEENLEFDSMVLLLEKYFEWVSEIQNDPN